MKTALLLLLTGLVSNTYAQNPPPSDLLSTTAGDVRMTFLGHGSLLFTFNKQAIYIDPWGKLTDYARLPKADIVLITHEHPDHLDPEALRLIRTTNTVVVLTARCAARVEGGRVMKNGETQTVHGLPVEAVPAYNLAPSSFHPRGAGNGYILTFGGQRVYVAGDTENTPEMKALRDIAVAFLPMNRPYTMTPEMVADAARAFKPRILYPYHVGDTDPAKLQALLKTAPEIEVRIRNLK